jgi:hypothetical protein
MIESIRLFSVCMSTIKHNFARRTTKNYTEEGVKQQRPTETRCNYKNHRGEVCKVTDDNIDRMRRGANKLTRGRSTHP